MIAIRIQGTIPESLGMLLYLTNINLDNNKLTVSGHSMSGPCIDLYPVWISLFFLQGPLPSSVFQALGALTAISISNNILTGTIPTNIGFTKAVSFLDLSNNLLVRCRRHLAS